MHARVCSEEDADDELLSVAILKSGKKLIAGCQSGVLALYSWGCFADCSDRYASLLLASYSFLLFSSKAQLLIGLQPWVLHGSVSLCNSFLFFLAWYDHEMLFINRFSFNAPIEL